MGKFKKDPDAVLDYGFDWSSFLVDDVIVSSTWDVPAGLTGVDESFSDTGTSLWLTGGTVGEVYTITNHIVTNNGREDDRSHTIRIIEK